MMNKQMIAASLCGMLGGAIAVSIGTHIEGARADVPAPAQSLFYSGLLFDQHGPVADGTYSVELQLYDSATAGSEVCDIAPQSAATTAGHFKVDVGACAGALSNAKTTLYVQIIANGMNIPAGGETRPPVGEVPYANQAAGVPFSGISGLTSTTSWPGTVASTSVTSPSGTIEQRLSNLESGATVAKGMVANVFETNFASLVASSGNPSVTAPNGSTLANVNVLSTPITYTPKFPNSLLMISATGSLGYTFTLSPTVRGDTAAILSLVANGVTIANGGASLYLDGVPGQQTSSGGATLPVHGMLTVPSTTPPAPITFQLNLETDNQANFQCPGTPAVCLFTIVEVRQ